MLTSGNLNHRPSFRGKQEQTQGKVSGGLFSDPVPKYTRAHREKSKTWFQLLLVLIPSWRYHSARMNDVHVAWKGEEQLPLWSRTWGSASVCESGTPAAVGFGPRRGGLQPLRFSGLFSLPTDETRDSSQNQSSPRGNAQTNHRGRRAIPCHPSFLGTPWAQIPVTP